MEQTPVIERSLSGPPAPGSELASALSPPNAADHALPVVGVEEHIEVSPPDVSGASGQAGQGDPPPPVPPVSDPPHPVAEASSGDGPLAPLPAPPYPHSALPIGHQAAYYPIGTPGPGFPGFAPPQVTPVPSASGFFPSAGPYATPVPQSVHHYWPLWQNVPSPSPPVPPAQQQPPWQPFPVPSPGHSVQVVTRWSELAKKAIDQLAIFSDTPKEDMELWKESFHKVVDEVRSLDGPHALGPQDLSGIIRQKVSSGVREVLRSCTVQADQIYDPSWLFDTLDNLYLGPYESRIRKRWRAIKALCPLASESVDIYFARAAKVFGRLRRLVLAMVFGSEPFVPFEYSILLESLPAEGGAHRYVLAHLQDYTPIGFRDCLRRYEQQLGTPTPSATIWFSSTPPSRSSSTPEPNHPKCIYCGVAHPWRKHVKCIACGASPHADCSTCPAIARVCGCGKQGHLDAMCPSKLHASKKAANVHCATVSFASAAVISPDLAHGPHFGKDNGATVEAVGELYLEKVSASITYTVKVLDTPVPVRTAGRNDSSAASGAVVYATHSVTLDDVIFGDRLESITFLILPQSSIPFLFSKALAQRLSVKMDYQDNVMVIPSPSGPDVTLT
uniref:Uncharacterized protein n=1 Tax=Chromera velia CCMP2878 TaxID=1169474 RepID=A0A0G4HPP9_9ALVE|eukprot:Cvel_7818.t1-p1 / transcript=Cvel_7818.t1 / gene=Cvel_7818 / organism=Chromera_velia_CCMP2878 / gene_product=hypothetical protein / transcript_product=hypothetical protein / location=Cvel_scaffold417:48558-50402(-) / protein_length=615 / sequence_SO=supercontig / SO=protein_coding / is_pseudo=false